MSNGAMIREGDETRLNHGVNEGGIRLVEMYRGGAALPSPPKPVETKPLLAGEEDGSKSAEAKKGAEEGGANAGVCPSL